MGRLHFAITVSLVAAVVVLTVLLLRQGRPGDELSAPTPIAQGRRIERVPDAELVFKRLGYAAWVFRWSGGMIDGEFRSGPGVPPLELGGAALSKDLRAFSRAEGTTAPELESMSGMVVVLIGPIKPGEGERPPTAPCRVQIYAEAGSTTGSREPAGPLQVAFADAAGTGDVSVQVFSKWKEHPGGVVSPDSDSKYTLLELWWLTDAVKD